MEMHTVFSVRIFSGLVRTDLVRTGEDLVEFWLLMGGAAPYMRS